MGGIGIVIPTDPERCESNEESRVPAFVLLKGTASAVP